MSVYMHTAQLCQITAALHSQAEIGQKDIFSSFQSQNIYCSTETSSLHWKSKLNNVWGQQNLRFYTVEMFKVCYCDDAGTRTKVTWHMWGVTKL